MTVHDVFFFYPPVSVDTETVLLTGGQPATLMPAISTAGPSYGSAQRHLLLLPSLQSVYINGQTDGFRFRLDVANPVNVDPFIFLYVAKPLAPGSAEFDSKFQKVCSPRDLISTPPGAPWPSCNPPYYRLDFVEFDCYTEAEALLVRSAVIADTNQLLTSLNTMDVLTPQEPIVIMGN